ncbi:hybrid sensor histidine kinase/response regulator [Tardiphaga alba]|uniref:histidine kinase n=1 Tax=Tardiphaga alba TaxID=340268 RepID=A0ABX8A392_9BRAD|nr:ATP-binding protein [Tardiphaga alba]QUS38054.1 hybrid sensor histidine kinase/response regulator [Tardiphaga alba]
MAATKIIVVEDDRIVARDIERLLRKMGHDVVGVVDRGEEVVDSVLRTQADLVLMDIRLRSDVDGIDAAMRVKLHCFVPVIFLTAYADSETVKRAIRTEPFGYVLKPVDEIQLSTAIDVALYKHSADRRTRESERRLETILTSIGDAVIATDSQAQVTYMNPVAQDLTGWNMPDAIGRPLPEVFHIVNEDTREIVEDPAAKVLRLGTIVGLANHTVLIRRDGSEIPIDDCGSPLIDDRGVITGTVLVFRDITERQRSEEALSRAQADLVQVARLTTMGELAVSIAHEINQPLLAFVTNAETCLLRLSQEPPDLFEAQQAAERAVGNGHRAGDVVRRIRALIQKSEPEATPLDLGCIVHEVLDLLRAEFRRRSVMLKVDVSPRLPPVKGDRIQLQQVLVNLIMNSLEALTEQMEAERTVSVGARLGDEGEVIIKVEDNGSGLESSNMDRMFDPFFTTKPGGMGMGLSISKSIVEAHGGTIGAEAGAAMRGSVFHFTLPAEARSSNAER